MKLPRITVTVEHAGKIGLVLVLAYVVGVFGFVLWAIWEHGR